MTVIGHFFQLKRKQLVHVAEALFCLVNNIYVHVVDFEQFGISASLKLAPNCCQFIRVIVLFWTYTIRGRNVGANLV